MIVDDGGYGMIRFDQDLKGDPREGVDLANPDFVALAARVRHSRGQRGRPRRAASGSRSGHVRAEGADAARGQGGAAAAAERVAALVPAVTAEEPLVTGASASGPGVAGLRAGSLAAPVSGFRRERS